MPGKIFCFIYMFLAVVVLTACNQPQRIQPTHKIIVVDVDGVPIAKCMVTRVGDHAADLFIAYTDEYGVIELTASADTSRNTYLVSQRGYFAYVVELRDLWNGTIVVVAKKPEPGMKVPGVGFTHPSVCHEQP